MPADANVHITVKGAEDRRPRGNSNLAAIVELLIDLARAHNHPACAEIWTTTPEASTKDQQPAEVVSDEVPLP